MVHGSEIIGQKFNSDHLLNFAKNTFNNKLNKLVDFVFSTRCLTKGYSIKNRPAIPI